MNGASKILTVSYGTFSCTLEGFDDPFNTMKAIAEYFRDLAAEDRYFGAEPPTPDAAMLHRIAEREIQRRVEAKIGEHGVILRANEAVAPKVSFPATRAAEAAPHSAAGLAPVPTLSSASQAAPAIESAAARLSRLRAGQAHAAPVAAIYRPAALSFVDAYGEDQDVAAPETAAAVVAKTTPAPAEPPAEAVIVAAQPAATESVVAAVAAMPPATAAIDVAQNGPAGPDVAEVEPTEVEPTENEPTENEPTEIKAEDAEAARAAAKELRRAKKARHAAVIAEEAAEAEVLLPPAAPSLGPDPKLEDLTAFENNAPVPLAADLIAAPVVPEPSARALAEPVAEPAVAAPAASGDQPEDILDAIALHLAKSSDPAVPAPVERAAPAAGRKTPDAAYNDLAAAIRETLSGIGAADDQLAIDISDADVPEPATPAESADFADDQNDYLPEIADLTDLDDTADAQAAPILPLQDATAELVAPAVTDYVAEQYGIEPAPLAAPDAPAPQDAVAQQDAVAPQDEVAQPDTALAEPVAAVAELAVDPAGLNAAPGDETPAEETSADEAPADIEPVIARGEPEVRISGPVVAEKIQRARARVIKIRRLDTQPHVEAGARNPVLSPEAEAALQHELAALEALEAELGTATPQTPAENLNTGDLPTGDLPTGDLTAEPHRLPVAETDEASVDRLLEKARTEAEVPESRRRRSAIAHLKAAVLATVAERRINPNGRKPDQRMEPYRKDLDQVVRPPVSDRPAPLVLVSSQRIDRKPDASRQSAPRSVPQTAPQTGPQAAAPSAAQAQPAAGQPTSLPAVRPRRVTTGASASQALSTRIDEGDAPLPDGLVPGGLVPGGPVPDDMVNVFADPARQGFQEFADGLGVTSMAELIEAAGAYCTLVLGQDNFTRPQLFEQISLIHGQTDLSREDSLRGFGRLLRDGRLTKTERGKYALADTSPILTEARRQVG